MFEILGRSHVVGIDIDIRAHNRAAIEAHPLAKRITLIQGSSIDEATVAEAAQHTRGKEKVFVSLDSNHTANHVARELDLYSPFVTRGDYLIVFDTLIDDMPASAFPDRPWGPGNGPKTAVHDFLKRSDRFEIDRELERRLLFTVAPDGYLRCTR